MCGVKRIDSSIKSYLILRFFFPHITFICTDIRQAEYDYKHQQPIKEKWMGSGQMGPRHPNSIWYVITRQKHGQEIDPWMKNGPLFTDIFGKQSILSFICYSYVWHDSYALLHWAWNVKQQSEINRSSYAWAFFTFFFFLNADMEYTERQTNKAR